MATLARQNWAGVNTARYVGERVAQVLRRADQLTCRQQQFWGGLNQTHYKNFYAGNTEIDFVPALSLNVGWVVPDVSKKHVFLFHSFQSPFKMETTRCVETLVTMYPVTQGQIVEKWNPWLHFYENLNTHFLDLLLIW